MRREALVCSLARALTLALATVAAAACPAEPPPGAAHLAWERFDAVAGFVPAGTRVELGAIDVLSPEELLLVLVNDGDASVLVRALDLDDASAFGVTATAVPLPKRLVPGARLGVTVGVAPGSTCTTVATLTVDAEDAAAAPPPLALGARGVDPSGPASLLAVAAARLDAVDVWDPLAPGATLDFGAQAPGGRATRLLRVDNGGDCPVAIDAVAVGASGPFTVAAAPGALALAPGASVALPLVFAPQGEPGARSDVLTLTTAAGTRDVPLIGHVGAPAIGFRVGSGGNLTSPGASGLDFGEAEVGARVARVVEVSNAGGVPLEIASITSDLSLFGIGWGAGDGVLTLAAGEAHEVPVAFLPDAAGSRIATLTVATPTGDGTLQLVGRGLAGALALSVESPVGSGAFVSLESEGEIDFGAADPGDESYRRVRLANAGDGLLAVSAANASNGFRAFLPVPVDLAPGQDRDFLVRFRPVASVPSYTGTLEVRTNRGVGAVTLRGALTRVCGAATAAPAVPDGPCVPDDTTLCLVDQRFAVTAANQSVDCGGGVAQVAVTDGTSGAFTFGGVGWDLVVNMVDDCATTAAFQFRAAGPTRDRVELRVVDTATGAVKTWFNPLGEPFQPLLDATAFDTCP